MALIKCAECNRDISDQAASCPGCGAPVAVSENTTRAPSQPSFVDGHFIATREMIADLARSAVQACNYRVDTADDLAGTLTFTTGVTMGSWTGVTGTIIYREVSPYRFEVTGAAKQNVRGGQVVALDLFGEAKGKIDKVIQEMRRRSAGEGTSNEGAAENGSASTGCVVLLVGMTLVPTLWALGQFS